jgi:hypothetical protein
MQYKVTNRMLRLNTVLFALTAFWSSTCWSAQYLGANASGESILIDYSLGTVADVTATPRSPAVVVRERWIARATNKGFALTTPSESRIAAAGVVIEYAQVVKKQDLFECKKGCSPRLPNIVAIKR